MDVVVATGRGCFVDIFVVGIIATALLMAFFVVVGDYVVVARVVIAMITSE